jgi:thiosulfate reductase cytochrome b subunit
MTRFPMGLRLALICLLPCLFCWHAVAGDARALNYRGGGQGSVIFDHRLHASKGYTCLDCHTRLPSTGKQLFQTQKQGMISIADHGSDSKCFACHNDKTAFSNCGQCHRK